jgi:TRAP-type uncharacterized transport system substrate-binding protein
MRTRLFVLLALTVLTIVSSSAHAAPKDLRWGTSQVGSAGHKALIELAALLNKAMPEYRIAVLPLPGAADSVKGYALGEYDAFYASQIAFHELATGTGRFKGFRPAMKREPLQAFWGFTLEAGIGIRARDAGKIRRWSDLAGKRVFTCPLPFDIHAHLERALTTLSVKHRYVQVDLSTVATQLSSGMIDAMCIYTTAETSPVPWLTEASLSVDWAVLNPGADEVAALKGVGFPYVELKPAVFGRDIHADHAGLVPILSGFGVTPEVPEADMYRMLTLIESNAKDLARADSSYLQVARDMPELQRRGVETSPTSFPIHPGLARYMRERGVWDARWDAQVMR